MNLIHEVMRKEHIHVFTLIYEALCYNEMPVSKRRVRRLRNLIERNTVPEFVLDYALDVLAGRAQPIWRAYEP